MSASAPAQSGGDPSLPPTVRAARRWPRRVVFGALLLVAPIALMGIVASSNEHAPSGVDAAADCDGALGVLVFAVPALAVYGLRLAWSIVDTLRRRAWSGRITLALCAVVCALLAGNIAAALDEQSRAAHRERCTAA